MNYYNQQQQQQHQNQFYNQQQQQQPREINLEKILRQRVDTYCDFHITSAINALPCANFQGSLARKYISACNQLYDETNGTSPDQICALSLFTVEHDISRHKQNTINVVNGILRRANESEIFSISDYLLFLLSGLSNFKQIESTEDLYGVVSLDDFPDIEQRLTVTKEFTCNEFIRLYTNEDIADLVKEMNNPFVFVLKGSYKMFDITRFSLNRERTLIIAPGAKIRVLGIKYDNNFKVASFQVLESNFPLGERVLVHFEDKIIRPFKECIKKTSFYNQVVVHEQCSAIYKYRFTDICSRYTMSKDEAMAIIAMTLDYGSSVGDKEPLVIFNKNFDDPNFDSFLKLLLNALKWVEIKRPIGNVYRVKKYIERDSDEGEFTNDKFLTAYKKLEEAQEFCNDSDVVPITLRGNFIAYDLEAFTQNGESLVLISPKNTFKVKYDKVKKILYYDGIRTGDDFIKEHLSINESTETYD